MNGVLSDITWGTWGDVAAPTKTALEGENAEPRSSTAAAGATTDKSRKKLDRKGLRAPKQSQLWFEEVLDRVRETAFGRESCCYRCNPLRCLHHDERPGLEVPVNGGGGVGVIPWDSLPEGIHPRDGHLPPERIRKKRVQVENLAVFLQRMLRPGDKVVEFCAGSGYVALPLACMFPQCTFVVLDMKEPSLAIAQERIAAAQLTNVEIFCGFIDDYDKSFDVGIALHACGEATDMVMQKCLDASAAFVLAPCCVGKIKLSGLAYPRSATLREVTARHEYEVLAKAADFGHTNTHAVALTPVNRRRRACKTVLESDRNMLAQEAGYETFMFVMHPPDVTPKNDVLVGLPPSSVVTTMHDAGKECDRAKRCLQLECQTVLDEDECRRVVFGLS